MNGQPKAWTCKHGCERDVLKDQIYALELANAELLDALKHLSHNVKATKKRLNLGVAMISADALIKQYAKDAAKAAK